MGTHLLNLLKHGICKSPARLQDLQEILVVSRWCGRGSADSSSNRSPNCDGEYVSSSPGAVSLMKPELRSVCRDAEGMCKDHSYAAPQYMTPGLASSR